MKMTESYISAGIVGLLDNLMPKVLWRIFFSLPGGGGGGGWKVAKKLFCRHDGICLSCSKDISKLLLLEMFFFFFCNHKCWVNGETLTRFVVPAVFLLQDSCMHEWKCSTKMKDNFFQLPETNTRMYVKNWINVILDIFSWSYIFSCLAVIERSSLWVVVTCSGSQPTAPHFPFLANLKN